MGGGNKFSQIFNNLIISKPIGILVSIIGLAVTVTWIDRTTGLVLIAIIIFLLVTFPISIAIIAQKSRTGYSIDNLESLWSIQDEDGRKGTCIRKVKLKLSSTKEYITIYIEGFERIKNCSGRDIVQAIAKSEGSKNKVIIPFQGALKRNSIVEFELVTDRDIPEPREAKFVEYYFGSEINEASVKVNFDTAVGKRLNANLLHRIRGESEQKNGENIPSLVSPNGHKFSIFERPRWQILWNEQHPELFSEYVITWHWN